MYVYLYQKLRYNVSKFNEYINLIELAMRLQFNLITW